MGDEIEQIKERLDLADIIGEYVSLKRVGGHFKGLCPFHQEKTPSFVVSPDKGIWHCFGCGAGGDVLSFVQRIESLDFPAALQILAERAGVELKRTAPAQRDERSRLFEVLDLVARLYHEVLLRQDVGKRARTYLHERGVRDETIEKFAIGYAPQVWDMVQRYATKKGFALAELIAAGLVGKNQQGKTYDRFRGRIMFPVHDVQGRVVAFGGRIVPWTATGNEGKYVNSPETQLYEKRRTVYNLHRAKSALRSGQSCLVVEGYMDVVMVAQAGIEGVVASSGTAFTAEQVQLLKRFTTTLHFAFDADAAGVKAAQAATREALTAGMHVATVLLPEGKDPADVAAGDSAELKRMVSEPTSLVHLMLRQLSSANSSSGQNATLEALLPLLATVANPIQQGEMIQEVAATLHVPESVITKKLMQAITAPHNPVPDNTETSFSLTVDQQLVGLLILEPTVRLAMTAELKDEYFLDEQVRNLYIQIQRLGSSEPAFARLGPDAVLSRLAESDRSLAEGLRRLAEERRAHSTFSPEQEAYILLRRLRQRHLEGRLRALQTKLTEPDTAQHTAVLKQFQAVAEELAAIKIQQS